MSVMKRALLLFLILLLATTPLLSCGGEGSPDDTAAPHSVTTPAESSDTTVDNTAPATAEPVTATPSSPETSAPVTTTPATTAPVTTAVPTPESVSGSTVFVSSTGYSEYRIVYPANASEKLKSTAESLASYINRTIPGASVYTASDTGRVKASANEIIVGAADRSEVPSLTAIKSNYVVRLSGKRLVLCGANDSATAAAVDYFKYHGFNDGKMMLKNNFSFSSDTVITLTGQTPEKYYYYENAYTPSLTFFFDSAAGIDQSKCKLIIGGRDYTSEASWSKASAGLTGKTFAAGDYTVFLCLTDTKGGEFVYESVFSCGDSSRMNLYRGEVHAHTSYSDGQGSPTQAYNYARDVAKLDFFSLTDHSNSLTAEEYTATRKVSDEINDPGRYVTLYGYEQTYNAGTGFFGHLNVLNFKSLTMNSMPLDTFYKAMSKQNNVTVMFNHPSYRWGNFLEYGLYSESTDKVMNLSEIKGSGYDLEYALSLTKGWHLSPMYNEDNHTPNWGAAYEYCGYALAPALTRENIIEAFAKNRTYTTTDGTLKIYYKINNEWMGSRLDNPDKLNVSVTLSTKKANGLGQIYLMGEDNIIVAVANAGKAKEYTWNLTIDPLFDYYYVKVVGSGIWCVTGPVWVENREELTIESLDYALYTNNPDSNNDYRVTSVFKNNSGKPMTNVTVSYYTSSEGGFSYVATTPSATVSYGTLAAGETASVSADLRYLAAIPRISAVVTADIGELKYGATTYMQISNLYITEIVSSTIAASGSADAYEYIELYNNSDKPLDLSKYSLRYYPKAGADTATLTANTWKLRGMVQPYSTVVLWVKANGNGLTISKFNLKYGTDLEIDKDVYCITGFNIPSSGPVQLELLLSTVVVNRVWYNWGTESDVLVGRSIEFGYSTAHTLTSNISERLAEPTPGKLSAGQVPEKITK